MAAPSYMTPAVPAPASAILFNLTIAETLAAGSLLVWAAGQTEPLASSINWTARDQVVANSVTSGCDASQAVQVAVSSGVAGFSTQFVLDVIGYYAELLATERAICNEGWPEVSGRSGSRTRTGVTRRRLSKALGSPMPALPKREVSPSHS